MHNTKSKTHKVKGIEPPIHWVGNESLFRAIQDLEERLIKKALIDNDYVIRRAAKALSINRTTLTQKCHKLNLMKWVKEERTKFEISNLGR